MNKLSLKEATHKINEAIKEVEDYLTERIFEVLGDEIGYLIDGLDLGTIEEGLGIDIGLFGMIEDNIVVRVKDTPWFSILKQAQEGANDD